MELHGKAVLVIGLGRNQGGAGVARWLAHQGATVRVTDLAGEEALRASVESLAGLPITFVLGRHEDEDVVWADVVIRNPAVPTGAPILALARALGKPILMEMAMFLARTESTVVGITGSKGKTTTSYICRHLVAPAVEVCELVGNMGIPALERADLGGGSVAVAEISSFQLEGMNERQISPHVAVLTSLFQDHLDRYDGYCEYVRTKLAIFDHQGSADWAIVPVSERSRVTPHVRGHAAHFAFPGEVLDRDESGAWLEGGVIRCRWDGVGVDLLQRAELPLPGDHNVANACAAVCAALALGVPPAIIAAQLRTAPRIEHRLEHVATINGVDYVNDSAATIPAAAAASVRTFDRRDVVLIMGGSDKRLKPDPLAETLVGVVREVVVLAGSASAGLTDAALAQGFSSLHGPVTSMADAVAEATRLARPGTVVLLAPGAASFGMFADEFDRGSQFRELVRRLEKSARESD